MTMPASLAKQVGREFCLHSQAVVSVLAHLLMNNSRTRTGHGGAPAIQITFSSMYVCRVDHMVSFYPVAQALLLLLLLVAASITVSDE